MPENCIAINLWTEQSNFYNHLRLLRNNAMRDAVFKATVRIPGTLNCLTQ